MAITDPRDIPGLVAWYSAEAETAFSDGAELTQWTDLSGAGNHALISGTGTTGPKWKATGGPSGGPRVFFDSPSATSNTGKFLQLPNVMAGATAGEIHVQIQAGSATAVSGHWLMGSGLGSNDHALYPYSDGKVYEQFGLPTGQRVSFTPTVSIASWRRYNVWSAVNDWAARLDGVTQATKTTSTPGWYAGPALGTGFNGGGNFRFVGSMTGVVIFNRKLTTTERDDLDAWMQAHPSGGSTAPSPAQLTLNAVAPPATAALDFTRTLPAREVTLAGVAPAATAAFAVEHVEPAPAVSEVTFSAAAPASVASLALTHLAPIDLAFSAMAPAATASFVLDNPDGQPRITFAAVAPAASAAFTIAVPQITLTDLTSDVSEGYNYDGESDVLDDGTTGSIPAGITLAPIRFVHQSLPAPVLVKGRPQ